MQKPEKPKNTLPKQMPDDFRIHLGCAHGMSGFYESIELAYPRSFYQRRERRINYHSYFKLETIELTTLYQWFYEIDFPNLMIEAVSIPDLGSTNIEVIINGKQIQKGYHSALNPSNEFATIFKKLINFTLDKIETYKKDLIIRLDEEIFEEHYWISRRNAWGEARTNYSSIVFQLDNELKSPHQTYESLKILSGIHQLRVFTGFGRFDFQIDIDFYYRNGIYLYYEDKKVKLSYLII